MLLSLLMFLSLTISESDETVYTKGKTGKANLSKMMCNASIYVVVFIHIFFLTENIENHFFYLPWIQR